MPTTAEDVTVSEAVRAAPKVLLHDHLDGGLRPATIVELAAEIEPAVSTTSKRIAAAGAPAAPWRRGISRACRARPHRVGGR